MSTLRIRHYECSGERFVDLNFNGSVLLEASHPFSPELDRFDLEDLRWYHENYFESWYVSSNAIVNRIKRAELKMGKALHHALFGHAGRMADVVRESLAELRVEIRDEVHGAAIPWESIADEETGERLVQRSSSFVRSLVGTDTAEYHQITQTVHRLLLVICRPNGKGDIGYWSVAYSLWESLRDIPSVKIDVLRPATFDGLEKYLSEAKQAGRPYAAVHFDGHGAIVDPFGGSSARGYLVFESAERSNEEFIDGVTIGQVLAANDVQHLSMNACRSADSQSADRRLRTAQELSIGQPSIVEEVLGEGVSSCIGMRREIYPGSATRFFNAFYPAFFSGHSAGEAAKIARSLLADDPLDANTFDASIAGIEDWSIPVVGECRPIRLGLGQAEVNATASDESVAHIPATLSRPSIVGLDREILTLETLFLDRKAILIYGPVLIGKSRLAFEYAKWCSATSVDPCPIVYIRLSRTCDATSVLKAFGCSVGRPVSSIADCADHLRSSGGVLILDQADRLSNDTRAVLTELVNEIRATCRIIVTSRSPNLDWLPEHSKLRPETLPRSKRVELARRWAEETGSPFDSQDYRRLLFFSGGLPGVLLLLVSSSCELISNKVASAGEISSWLHLSEWRGIARLSRQPWPDLPSIEDLVSDLVADVEATCDPTSITVLPLLSRFHVCVDLDSAVRLVREAQTSAAAPDRHTIESLESVGLLFPVDRFPEPTWHLHPLLKLVVSRLPGVIKTERGRLDQIFVGTIAGVCANLIREYRHDARGVTDKLAYYEQNILDALQIALQSDRTNEAANLVTAAGWFYRYFGDIKKMTLVFNHALPYFVDSWGAVRSNCRDIAMPLWDLAIWLAPDWPRNAGLEMQPPVNLVPPDEDFYAIGLWLRAEKRYREAEEAFQLELVVESGAERYAPGDLQYQISETVYDASDPETWAAALEYAQESFDSRRPDDAIGRAASRIAEARIRLVQILNHERYWLQEDDITTRIEILPEDLRQMDGVAELLREAEAEPGGMSVENKSQTAMVWWRIVLGRGDLTSAVAYFEEGAELMMDMQELPIWHHYHVFSLALLRHGWITRSYETAVNAFQFAMYSGDVILQTRLREFCERLEATYPELEELKYE